VVSERMKRKIRDLQKAHMTPCPECALRQTQTRVVYPEDSEQVANREPRFCPSCGDHIEEVVIRVVYDYEEHLA
jgi:hypothetical protein